MDEGEDVSMAVVVSTCGKWGRDVTSCSRLVKQHAKADVVFAEEAGRSDQRCTVPSSIYLLSAQLKQTTRVVKE